ncbi:3'-5' exonuclease [Pelagibius marinus]|uniref:3'-5' exonuclease n=1 Tax=Pelagibius marinus TaxID=2762760 RepID=UPI00187338E2|nr:3'-5' exonuclease [Pelagibius marinus]
MMSNPPDYETMAKALEATGDYRILRRLPKQATLAEFDGSETRRAVVLDLETTGLDPYADEIIEIGMVPFTYALDGRIFGVGDPFSGLRQPSQPIPSEVAELTGITDAMVKGHAIEPGDIEKFIDPAALIIAHNAAFDRRFSEQFCSAFANKPWACSLSQIPWAEEGFGSTKLAQLLADCGYFFDGHRAVDDCRAVVELLSRPLPKSGRPALGVLLEVARSKTCRIWAENSPFESKDILKARGYRWNGENNGKPRSWYFDATEETVESELAFLQSEILARNAHIRVDYITAADRFSERS